MTAGEFLLRRTVRDTGHSALWYRIADAVITGLAVSVAVFAIVLGLGGP